MRTVTLTEEDLKDLYYIKLELYRFLEEKDVQKHYARVIKKLTGECEPEDY